MTSLKILERDRERLSRALEQHEKACGCTPTGASVGCDVAVTIRHAWCEVDKAVNREKQAAGGAA